MRKARPLRNPDVEELRLGESVTLTGPAVLKGLLGKIVSKATTKPVTKQYELEEIGAFVWSQIDGRKSFDGIAKQLQAKYKMNRMEAEASLDAFLRMLAERGLITLLVKESK
ncbi:MAG TPA: PqqD family protein [Fimbriimonadaceae bacterium]|nr:PqqD family protein [Fimbriimonadaceae bacterium]